MSYDPTRGFVDTIGLKNVGGAWVPIDFSLTHPRVVIDWLIIPLASARAIPCSPTSSTMTWATSSSDRPASGGRDAGFPAPCTHHIAPSWPHRGESTGPPTSWTSATLRGEDVYLQEGGDGGDHPGGVGDHRGVGGDHRDDDGDHHGGGDHRGGCGHRRCGSWLRRTLI